MEKEINLVNPEFPKFSYTVTSEKKEDTEIRIVSLGTKLKVGDKTKIVRGDYMFVYDLNQVEDRIVHIFQEFLEEINHYMSEDK